MTWFFKGLLILGMLVLTSRLFELQVIKGSYYRSLSDDNRIRKIPIRAPRGKIIARGGEVLVSGGTERDYVYGATLAHVAGYLGEVDAFEAGKVDPHCQEKGHYALGALTGKNGLEKEYECILRGIDGEELVEVDTTGQRVRTLGIKEPTSGNDIRISIDINLQAKVVDVINKSEDIPLTRKVAIIITDTKGEILAFYSSPSFDPDNVSNYLNDPSLSLFNRVISGSYPPGSIYKMVTTIAAIEENAIEPDYEYEDTGVIKVNEFDYTNWYFTQYGRTEGLVNLPRAIARSTDTFFYKVGELTGVDNLVKWSEKLGLGDETGIDLPGEIVGLLPTPEWKKAIKGERWFLGNTYHMAIGQGDLTVTPVGLNQMISTIASQGELCSPTFVGEPKCKNINIADSTFEIATEGMVQACSEGGTAFPFFDFPVKVACKTGTAETFEDDDTHAWFSVFAPAEKPEIVATILVEKGGEGSKNAAPLMREILDYWYLTQNP